MPQSAESPDGITEKDLTEVIKTAISLLRAARKSQAGVDRPLAYQAAALYRVNENDSREVSAALYSAVIELREKYPGGAQALAADRVDQIAEQLVRVAHNRARRNERAHRKLLKQAAAGEHGPDDASARALDQVEAGPVDFRKIHAQLSGVLGSIYDGLDSQDRDILVMCAEGFTQDEVAERFKCHRSKVSRLLTRVRHRFDAILANDET